MFINLVRDAREIKSLTEIPGMSVSASNSWCILVYFKARDKVAHFFWISSKRGGGARVDWCKSGGRHICRMQSRVSFTPLGMHGFDSNVFSEDHAVIQTAKGIPA